MIGVVHLDDEIVTPHAHVHRGSSEEAPRPHVREGRGEESTREREQAALEERPAHPTLDHGSRFVWPRQVTPREIEGRNPGNRGVPRFECIELYADAAEGLVKRRRAVKTAEERRLEDEARSRPHPR